MWGTMGNAAFRRIEREAERINARRKRRKPLRQGGRRGPKLLARGRARRPRERLAPIVLHALLYLALALGVVALAVRYAG